MDLSNHPIWKNIGPIKKQGHLLRFWLSSQYAKLFPRSIFIGVTGSVGKTTTVIAAKMVLMEKFQVVSSTDTVKSIVNLDPLFNIPLTILRAPLKTKKIILEMGIEYPGEMDLYLKAVKPATAIITSIASQHSEFLGSLENIALEKGKLVEQLPQTGFAILNYEDPLTRKMAEKTAARVIFYGLTENKCHIWAGNIRTLDFTTIFELNHGVERVEVRSNLLGAHNINAMLAGAALGISVGIPLVRIKIGLEKLEPVEHRMQALSGFNNSIIIDDTYNAAPIAVEQAIDTLNFVPARRRIVVLGEMRELGEHSKKMHQNIAQKIYKDKIDLVLLGGGDTKYIYDELIQLGFIKERLLFNMQNPQIVSKLLKILAKGDVVLIKGARAVRLDEVVKRVTKIKR